MMSKLMQRGTRSKSQTECSIARKNSIPPPRFGGMYFDTDLQSKQPPLLLPDESCLAEDKRGRFDLTCERDGFHLFGFGDLNMWDIHAKFYLTNYRV
jgi:hypothetical protein